MTDRQRVAATPLNAAAVRSRRGRALAALLSALVATASMGAAAAPPKPVCYSRAEHAAEQLIRMHTEMMVVGLTCQSVMPDLKPFDAYHAFTVKNRDLISSNEAVLIQHFRKTASGNPTRRFDTYRTELANEISRRAATIGTNIYCAEFVQRLKSAGELSNDDIKVLISNEKDAGLMHLSSRPLCDVKVASMPDAPPAAAVEPARGKKAPPAKAATAKATKPAAKPPAKVAQAPAKPLTTAQKP